MLVLWLDKHTRSSSNCRKNSLYILISEWVSVFILFHRVEEKWADIHPISNRYDLMLKFLVSSYKIIWYKQLDHGCKTKCSPNYSWPLREVICHPGLWVCQCEPSIRKLKPFRAICSANRYKSNYSNQTQTKNGLACGLGTSIRLPRYLQNTYKLIKQIILTKSYLPLTQRPQLLSPPPTTQPQNWKLVKTEQT